MSVVIFIMIGIVIGALARVLVLRGAPGGLALALWLGTAGAMSAGYLTQTFAWQKGDDTDWAVIAAIFGAVVVLLGYRLDLSRAKGHLNFHGLKLRR